MKFQEKLKLLMEDRKQKPVAIKVGVHPITLASYINHGAMPGADKAFRLAKALGVDVGWLLDDSQDFPCARNESSAPAQSAA